MNQKKISSNSNDSKYFSKIHGHEKIINSLIEKIRKKKLPHAIIISGKKGIGKSKIAKNIAEFLLISSRYKNKEDNFILQNYINDIFLCEKGKNEKEIENKNILISDIRKLKGFFELKSADDNWRISIIDSLDELTVPASNALLKLIEEPPKKSLFLLVCHNLLSVKSTIRSRCQIFKCNPLKNKDINLILENIIIDFKKLSIEEKNIIIALSNGSPGKAKNIVELKLAKHYMTLIESFSPSISFDREKIHKIINEISKNKIKKESFLLIRQIISLFIYRVTLFIFKNEIKFINEKEKSLFNMIRNKKFNAFSLPLLYIRMEKKFRDTNILNLDDEQNLITTLIDIEKTFNDEKLYYR